MNAYAEFEENPSKLKLESSNKCDYGRLNTRTSNGTHNTRQSQMTGYNKWVADLRRGKEISEDDQRSY